MDLIQFYARLVATLHPCLEDIATTLVEILIKDLRFQIKKKDQVHIHSKLKNVRFIGTRHNTQTHFGDYYYIFYCIYMYFMLCV